VAALELLPANYLTLEGKLFNPCYLPAFLLRAMLTVCEFMDDLSVAQKTLYVLIAVLSLCVATDPENKIHWLIAFTGMVSRVTSTTTDMTARQNFLAGVITHVTWFKL